MEDDFTKRYKQEADAAWGGCLGYVVNFIVALIICALLNCIHDG